MPVETRTARVLEAIALIDERDGERPSDWPLPAVMLRNR
jgi:hypothetical protein